MEFKKYIKNFRILAIAGALAVTFLQGCTKDTAPKIGGQPLKPIDFGSVPFVVKDNYTFSMYSATLDATKYSDTLSQGAGPYTTFVPNNNAFTTSHFYYNNGINYLLSAFNPPTADYVRNLILPQKLSMKDLPLEENQPYQTLGGAPVYITKYKGPAGDTVITVNGMKLVANGWDLPATNGTINVLADIPEPLVQPSVWQVMLSDGGLAFFTLAIQRAGLQSMFETTSEKITVLAPSNYALANMYVDTANNGLDLRTIDAIRSANPDSLKKMILYHVLKGIWFTNDFTRKDTLLNGDTLRLTSYGGAVFGYKNGSFIGPGLVPGKTYSYPNGVETAVYNGPLALLPIYYYTQYLYNMPRVAYADKPAGNGIVQELNGILYR